MGRGIAHVAAAGGFDVALQDISEEQLNQAMATIEKNMKKAVEIGKMSAAEVDQALNRISVTTNMEAAAKDADLVIEAVLELMELKIDVFRQLDKICPLHTVLATNTSTISPTEIAAATNRPQQCIAMHFFNPVHKMKLVEIRHGQIERQRRRHRFRTSAGSDRDDFSH